MMRVQLHWILGLLLSLSFVLGAKSAPIRKEQAPFVAKITIQNTITDQTGRVFDLNVVQPDATIFDPQFYEYDNPHSTEVIAFATGRRIPVAVYRGNYKGAAILMGKDENEAITFLQLRPPKEDPIFFYGNTTDHTLIGVRSSDFDYSGAAMEHGDDIEVLEANAYEGQLFPVTPAVPRRRRKSSSQGRQQRRTQVFEYERGDGDSDECSVIKIISMAVAYDAEFCLLHRGDATAAEIAIQIIVAGASEYYENDMCTKIRLTSIVPDVTCSTTSSYYTSFTKTSCGGDPGFLRQFSTFMATNRAALNIDSNSLVHIFSGAVPPGEIRGCAWRPGLCSLDFGYGVLYQSANHPDPVAQALLFAHELGHNLNAQHDSSTVDVSPHYIMEPIENDGSNGFSQASIDSMLALIDSDSITCDSEEVVSTPAPRETPVPSTMPSDTPAVQPVGTAWPTVTLAPSAQPSLSTLPSILPSAAPVNQPSERPTIQPITKFPTVQPTSTPPSPSSTPGPTNPSGCDFVPQSFCVPASGLNNDYACFPKAALVELASTCDNAYFLQLTGCVAEIGGATVPDVSDSEANDNSQRRTSLRGEKEKMQNRDLRKRRKRGKKGKVGKVGKKGGDDDDDENSGKAGKSKGGDDDDDDDGGSNTAPSTPTRSPILTPTCSPALPVLPPTPSPTTASPAGGGNSDRAIRFQATDCASSCIALQEFVCINALKSRVISAFYEMTDTSGAQQKLQSLIVVLPETTGSCVQPAATCVETTPDMSTAGAAEVESPEMAESLMAASGGRIR